MLNILFEFLAFHLQSDTRTHTLHESIPANQIHNMYLFFFFSVARHVSNMPTDDDVARTWENDRALFACRRHRCVCVCAIYQMDSTGIHLRNYAKTKNKICHREFAASATTTSNL